MRSPALHVARGTATIEGVPPPVVPPRLRPGDHVRVVCPSRTLGGLIERGHLTRESLPAIDARLSALGLTVSLGEHVFECDDALTTTVEARASDLHAAFRDPAVRAVFCGAGGFNAIQILRAIDFDLVRANPKIVLGYSDVGTLLNALLALAGVVGYYGPNYGGLAQEFGVDYTLKMLRTCLFEEPAYELSPADSWSDSGANVTSNDGPFGLQPGAAAGRIVGGSLRGLTVLGGTPFFPPLAGSILFLESAGTHHKLALAELDVELERLIHQPGFPGVRGIVLGRFRRSTRITRERLTTILANKPELRRLPIAGGFDFGHTLPRATLPIGGECKLRVDGRRAAVTITRH